jgi:hypothetical protein
MAQRPQQALLDQPGYLEPVGEPGPYTIASIFGKSVPFDLVLNNHPSHLSAGADLHAVQPMSGVQTIDVPGAGDTPQTHVKHASNLLHPMHSEAFWVLLLALVAVGLFSGQIRVGPLKASVGR